MKLASIIQNHCYDNNDGIQFATVNNLYVNYNSFLGICYEIAYFP